MAEFRIDDLARAAGTTVRHVRGFQERGLLPPPRMQGRVGFYDDSHLARIRVITQLQERGYTLASIAEMITAWERGHNLSDLLGLERALTDPWSDETAATMSLTEVVQAFVPDYPAEELDGRTPADLPDLQATLARAEELEFIRWNGDAFEVPSPRLFQVGADLVAIGIGLNAVFDIAAKLRGDCDAISRRFVQLTVDHAGLGEAMSGENSDLVQLAEVVRRLRPVGIMAVQGLLARSLHAEIQAELSKQMARIAEHSRTAPGQ
ncbi:MerR family transcriptional regulator [Actinomadura barringtoniae]|uniref:MerR family transcriptional regulator n=1 Tax=Actinomadura barringtoniae TaxID=1427535 RepID=A0A939TGS9_9ACTN|nr:MerR family transcriptional regulator [Actinomadura barringtoniae]MBO2455725.1 MerR family transcriptional regulator [Actinomadura barringtoniae]